MPRPHCVPRLTSLGMVADSDAQSLASLPVDELARWTLRAMIASKQATFQRSNSSISRKVSSPRPPRPYSKTSSPSTATPS